MAKKKKIVSKAKAKPTGTSTVDKHDGEKDADLPEASLSRSSLHWADVRQSVGAIAGESYRLRSERTIEEAHEGNFNADVTDRKEAEGKEILELLRKSNFFQNLPEKNKKAVMEEQERKTGKIHALDVLAMRERGETVESDQEEEYTKDRKRREKEQEDYRLRSVGVGNLQNGGFNPFLVIRYLWTQRHCCVNWSLWILFHLVVLVNFAICLAERF